MSGNKERPPDGGVYLPDGVAVTRPRLPNVYLHAGRPGEIWYLADYGQPQSTTDMRAVMDRRPRPRARVVGVSENVPLLLELDALHTGGRVEVLQVCSPRCITTPTRHLAPASALWEASACHLLPPSLGGWHDFVDTDRLTYQLAVAPEALRAPLFTSHPLSKPLGFVPHLDPAACARLLGELRDPRWYVDAASPLRESSLSAYLGLSPPVQAGVSGNGPLRYGHERCALVLACWKTAAAPPPDYRTDPSLFLWRCWARRGGGPTGDLRAGQAFVRFLASVWLQWIYLGVEELFVPEYVFTEPATAAAFRNYGRTALPDWKL